VLHDLPVINFDFISLNMFSRIQILKTLVMEFSPSVHQVEPWLFKYPEDDIKQQRVCSDQLVGMQPVSTSSSGAATYTREWSVILHLILTSGIQPAVRFPRC
jgi:hypothetical protein